MHDGLTQEVLMETENARTENMRNLANVKMDEIKEWSNDMLGRVEGFVRERPGTALLIAVGAGLLVGRIMRRL
jgi:ElaB/YqjD/DUF883 family membrane-anchored ribosome-binding protein